MKKIVLTMMFFVTLGYSQKQFINEPLVSEIFTADPSAHVFNGKIYVYPSHDIVEENPTFNHNKKSCPEHQHHPEYTQSSYLRLRCLEEAF